MLTVTASPAVSSFESRPCHWHFRRPGSSPSAPTMTHWQTSASVAAHWQRPETPLQLAWPTDFGARQLRVGHGHVSASESLSLGTSRLIQLGKPSPTGAGAGLSYDHSPAPGYQVFMTPSPFVAFAGQDHHSHSVTSGSSRSTVTPVSSDRGTVPESPARVSGLTPQCHCSSLDTVSG